jgi:tol-pal system-associated acyl-CoA thioesterase
VTSPAIHEIDVYYEDTDFSGVVYHPNYLRYFERAREHMLGRDELVRLWDEEGVGFVVYKADLTFKEGAVFGDRLEIRTTANLESDFRVIFEQRAHRAKDGALLVDGLVHLVCVGPDKKLVKLPDSVLALMR